MNSSHPHHLSVHNHDVFELWSQEIRMLLEGLYGPGGGYSLIESGGSWEVTADGARAIALAPVENPMVSMWESMLAAQRGQYGDGSTFTGLFGVYLVEEAAKLIADGCHPRTVRRGFTDAHSLALDSLDSLVSEAVDGTERCLKAAAGTTGVSSPSVLSAIQTVVANHTAADEPQVLSRVGDRVSETEPVPGPFLTKEPVNPSSLPREDVRILLVNQRLYLESDETNRTHTLPPMRAESPSEVDAVKEGVGQVYSEWTKNIRSVSPDVIVSLQGIDLQIKRRLCADGITVIQRAKPESVLDHIASATGGTVVSSLSALDRSVVGQAERVELRTYNGLPYVFFHEPDGGHWSLLVRGWTWSWTELIEQAVSSLVALGNTARDSAQFIPGAGVAETQMATAVRTKAPAASDKSQLAWEGYATALERTVNTLYENLGQDPFSALEIRSTRSNGTGHAQADETGGSSLADADVLEVAPVKVSALGKSTNAVLTLLKVDGLIDNTKTIQ